MFVENRHNFKSSLCLFKNVCRHNRPLVSVPTWCWSHRALLIPSVCHLLLEKHTPVLVSYEENIICHTRMHTLSLRSTEFTHHGKCRIFIISQQGNTRCLGLPEVNEEVGKPPEVGLREHNRKHLPSAFHWQCFSPSELWLDTVLVTIKDKAFYCNDYDCGFIAYTFYINFGINLEFQNAICLTESLYLISIQFSLIQIPSIHKHPTWL